MILLEEEITEYEPFGRHIINSSSKTHSCLLSPTTIKQKQSQDNSRFELEDELTLSDKLFNNLTLNPNCTIAELDGTRDLFRTTADVLIAKKNRVSFPVRFCLLILLYSTNLICFRLNFGGSAKVLKAKRNCMFRANQSY